jgi:molybdenum cofactor cytidylyltransferase
VPEVIGLLLAAGSSSRFGSDKLAALVPGDAQGRTVLQCSAYALQTAITTNIVAIKAYSEITSAHLSLPFLSAKFTCIAAQNSSRGMGATLAALVRAVQAAHPQAQGVIVMLADLPFVQPSSIAAVASALRAGASLAAPTYQGQRGHPVGFAAQHFDALAQLDGDAGAQALVHAHRQALQLIPVDDPGVLHDVDTPERLQAGAV